MKNIIALKTNCFKGYSLDEMIIGIKEAGYKYLELSATPNNSSGISRFQDFSKLCEIKEKLYNNQLIPISLGGHTNIMDEELKNDFINNIKLAHFFNCKYIVTSVGDPHIKEEEIVKDEIVANNIKFFIPYLDKYDINLVIELHGNHYSAEIVSKILNLVNNQRIKINYDTGNAVFYGLFSNEELLNDFSNHIDEIGYMHLKDKLGKKNEWNFPALGDGYIPFKDIFKTLKENNNYSPLSVEIEFTKEGPKNIEEINTAIKKSAIFLKENGFSLD